jgi:hypothetical protein
LAAVCLTARVVGLIQSWRQEQPRQAHQVDLWFMSAGIILIFGSLASLGRVKIFVIRAHVMGQVLSLLRRTSCQSQCDRTCVLLLGRT